MEQSRFQDAQTQLESLKNQDKLRNTEIQTLIAEIKDAKSLLASAQQTASAKDQEAKDANALFEQAEKKSISLTSAIEELTKNAQEAAAAAEERVAAAESKLLAQQEKIAQTEAQLSQANAEIDKLKGKLEKLSNEFDEKARLFNESNEKRRSIFKSELTTIADERNAIQEQNIEFYRQIKLQLEEIKKLNEEREKLSNELLAKNQQLDAKLANEQLESDHATQRQIITDQKVEIDEKLKVIQEQNEQISRYEKLLSRLQNAQEQKDKAEIESIERDLRVINLLQDRVDDAKSVDAIINAFAREEDAAAQATVHTLYSPQTRRPLHLPGRRYGTNPLDNTEGTIRRQPQEAKIAATTSSINPLRISKFQKVDTDGNFLNDGTVERGIINVKPGSGTQGIARRGYGAVSKKK